MANVPPVTTRTPELPAETIEAMLAGLPGLADRMVEAVIAEVPTFAVAARESWRPVFYASPSTVRYRLRQLRELFGDRLHDPGSITELTVALACGIRSARQTLPPGGDPSHGGDA